MEEGKNPKILFSTLSEVHNLVSVVLCKAQHYFCNNNPLNQNGSFEQMVFVCILKMTVELEVLIWVKKTLIQIHESFSYQKLYNIYDYLLFLNVLSSFFLQFTSLAKYFTSELRYKAFRIKPQRQYGHIF